MAHVDDVTGHIVDAALVVHRGMGPGLLESVYEAVLAESLRQRGLSVQRQLLLPFTFNGMRFDEGLRVDLLVERCVVVELKSVERMARVHAKQVLTYLRLLDLRVGLLINFGSATLREGLKRIVNRYVPPSSAPPRLRVPIRSGAPTDGLAE